MVIPVATRLASESGLQSGVGETKNLNFKYQIGRWTNLSICAQPKLAALLKIGLAIPTRSAFRARLVAFVRFGKTKSGFANCAE